MGTSGAMSWVRDAHGLPGLPDGFQAGCWAAVVVVAVAICLRAAAPAAFARAPRPRRTGVGDRRAGRARRLVGVPGCGAGPGRLGADEPDVGSPVARARSGARGPDAESEDHRDRLGVPGRRDHRHRPGFRRSRLGPAAGDLQHHDRRPVGRGPRSACRPTRAGARPVARQRDRGLRDRARHRAGPPARGRGGGTGAGRLAPAARSARRGWGGGRRRTVGLGRRPRGVRATRLHRRCGRRTRVVRSRARGSRPAPSSRRPAVAPAPGGGVRPGVRGRPRGGHLVREPGRRIRAVPARARRC